LPKEITGCSGLAHICKNSIIEKTNPGETKYQEKSPEIIKKKPLKKTPFYEIASFGRKGRGNIFLHRHLMRG